MKSSQFFIVNRVKCFVVPMFMTIVFFISVSPIHSQQKDTANKINWKEYKEPSGSQVIYQVFPDVDFSTENDGLDNSMRFSTGVFARMSFNSLQERSILRFSIPVSLSYLWNPIDSQGNYRVGTQNLYYSKYFKSRRKWHFNINENFIANYFSVIDFFTLGSTVNIGLGHGRLENAREAVLAYRIIKNLQRDGVSGFKLNQADVFDMAQYIRSLFYDFQRDNRRFNLYRNEQVLEYVRAAESQALTSFQIASVIDQFNFGISNFNESLFGISQLSNIFVSQQEPQFSLQSGSIVRGGISSVFSHGSSAEFTLQFGVYGGWYYGKILNPRLAFRSGIESFLYVNLGGRSVTTLSTSIIYSVNSRSRLSSSFRAISDSDRTNGYRVDLYYDHTFNYNTTLRIIMGVSRFIPEAAIPRDFVRQSFVDVVFSHYILP